VQGAGSAEPHTLTRIAPQRNPSTQPGFVRDAKLVRLTRNLSGKLYTTDYNLGKVAALQGVPYLNIAELAMALKPVILPGQPLNLRLTREGKEKGQELHSKCSTLSWMFFRPLNSLTLSR